ncbi:MAG: MarR family transcriptional regulator [bacterium]|nr:MarR family transcriptional regulator [bacterium]MXZ31071.1 MarR family transcriptional regulator [Acidimicrobiia bacterium]MDE0668221.1 MarR family transcriptional regulator [bacterium]MYB25467.1 MarR family transcriptional regulator [Acidimicrobiia bacterium]MYE67903.1 MarR family transcriptional regulator [Acidimicrobiia bacterium]
MQTQSREELTQRLVESAERLNRELRLDHLSEWQELALTIPQAKTLLLLEREGPQRMGAIAGALGIAVSATTTVVDRLVERGLAERLSDPKDRRVVICGLTDQGRQAADRFWAIGHERIRALAGQLRAEQLTGLVQAIERLCDDKAEAPADS